MEKKKGTGFYVDIALTVVLFVGIALCVLNAILIAPNNAMLDYQSLHIYNEKTSRQTAGWWLCLVPVLLSAGGGVLYWMRNKKCFFLPLSSLLATISVIMPIIYMAKFDETMTFTIIGIICIGVFAIAAIEFWLLRNTQTINAWYPPHASVARDEAESGSVA